MNELSQLWKNLVGCVIKLTEHSEEMEINPDPGMMGKVIKVIPHYDHVVEVCIDFGGVFLEHNKQIAKPNFYDSNGAPTLTWFESGLYPKDGVESIFFHSGDLGSEKQPFEITDKSSQPVVVFFTRAEAESLLTHVTIVSPEIQAKIRKAMELLC